MVKKPKGKCGVEGCERKEQTRGFCDMHYRRFLHHGDPNITHQKPKTGFVCEVEGCDRPRKGDGLCAKHWSRRKRHGDPIADGVEERGFVREWIQNIALNWKSDECLQWPFYRHSETGYGQLSVGGKRTVASRFVCQETYGPPPKDQYYEAAHSCGNGHEGCVNPLHLRWATSKQNNDDKLIHGTIIKGEQIHCSKLTETDIIQIFGMLKSGVVQKNIAALFGVQDSTISKIKHGKRWKHITGFQNENQ